MEAACFLGHIVVDWDSKLRKAWARWVAGVLGHVVAEQ